MVGVKQKPVVRGQCGDGGGFGARNDKPALIIGGKRNARRCSAFEVGFVYDNGSA